LFSERPTLPYFIGMLATIAICVWNYHNGSFDMGLHYSLIAYIGDQFHLPNCQTSSYLSEFCFYPPVAHIAGALLGGLTGSPFLGMHILTLVAVYTCYIAFFTFLRFRDDAASFAVLGCFVALSLALHSKTFFFGAEVRGNYFFAQLVGNACLLGFLVTQPKPRLIPTLIAIIVFGWLYALASVQLAAIMIVWMALQRASIFRIAGFAVLAAASIYFHPKFQQSISLGSNYGDVDTGWILPFAILPVIAALAICAGLLAVEQWRGKLALLNGNRLVAIASGIAGAASIQALAYYALHSGSEYIVRKHAFAVGTVLVGCLIVLAIHSARRYWFDIGLHPIAIRLAVVAAAVLSTAAVLKPGRDSSTSNMVAAEKLVRADPNAVLAMKKGTDRFALEMGVNRRPKADAFADNVGK
jgi:hypothetical protein